MRWCATCSTRCATTGLTLKPLCPYVRSYLVKHPEYADLVGPGAGNPQSANPQPGNREGAS